MRKLSDNSVNSVKSLALKVSTKHFDSENDSSVSISYECVESDADDGDSRFGRRGASRSDNDDRTTPHSSSLQSSVSSNSSINSNRYRDDEELKVAPIQFNNKSGANVDINDGN